MNVDRQRYRRRAEVLKAMGHPSRLMMLEALQAGEMCVCDLQRLVGSDMSTISKHLAVLRNAGILADEKRGLQVFYRLRVPCVTRFFECVEEVLEQDQQEASTGSRR